MWIHVATVGEWNHPSGPFSLSEANFDQMIAGLAGPIPVDFEFGSVLAVDAAPLGLVVGLEKRTSDSGRLQLWVDVSMSSPWPSAGKLYGGGVLEFDSIDRVTGADRGIVLRSMALTATPFFDDHVPIARDAE